MTTCASTSSYARFSLVRIRVGSAGVKVFSVSASGRSGFQPDVRLKPNLQVCDSIRPGQSVSCCAESAGGWAIFQLFVVAGELQEADAHLVGRLLAPVDFDRRIARVPGVFLRVVEVSGHLDASSPWECATEVSNS